MYQKMQDSGIKLVSLLPVEYRSHDAISELMTSKVYSHDHTGNQNRSISLVAAYDVDFSVCMPRILVFCIL